MKPPENYRQSRKRFACPFVAVVLAGCSWSEVTFAQTVTDPGEAGGAETGSRIVATGAGVGEGNQRSPFRIGESKPMVQRPNRARFSQAGSGFRHESTSRRLLDEDRPESAKSEGSQVEPAEQEPAAFVAPGFYGQGSQILVSGQGRLARPRFRYGMAVMNGYDDNTFLLPDVNLGAVGQPRRGTGFTTTSGHFEAQWAKPRSVFSLDLDVAFTSYWNRDRNREDYNARIGLLYLKRIDPRNQFTTNLSFAYLSQPDFSNVFASQSTVGGDYLTMSSKFDFLHRWAPHFSTNTTAAASLLYFTEAGQGAASNNFLDLTFGNEFRFLASPRLTWIFETRYGLQEYFDNSGLNSDTAYFLGGVDWMWSRRLATTFRVGAALRSFDAGGSSTDPYFELSANYKASRRASVIATARYGYEQTNVPGGENLSYRLNLLYRRAITQRLSGDVGFSYVRTDYSAPAGPGSTSDIFDLNFGLQYQFNRHFSVGARYLYTNLNSSTGLQDYDRNRVTFSADYQF